MAIAAHRDSDSIGEEVGWVLPKVVAYEQDCEFVTRMDYSKVTPLLVEAIKALPPEKDAQIDSQQAQVAALEQGQPAIAESAGSGGGGDGAPGDALQKR